LVPGHSFAIAFSQWDTSWVIFTQCDARFDSESIFTFLFPRWQDHVQTPGVNDNEMYFIVHHDLVDLEIVVIFVLRIVTYGILYNLINLI
jgi:hypothetical protein